MNRGADTGCFMSSLCEDLQFMILSEFTSQSSLPIRATSHYWKCRCNDTFTYMHKAHEYWRAFGHACRAPINTYYTKRRKWNNMSTSRCGHVDFQGLRCMESVSNEATTGLCCFHNGLLLDSYNEWLERLQGSNRPMRVTTWNASIVQVPLHTLRHQTLETGGVEPVDGFATDTETQMKNKNCHY